MLAGIRNEAVASVMTEIPTPAVSVENALPVMNRTTAR